MSFIHFGNREVQSSRRWARLHWAMGLAFWVLMGFAGCNSAEDTETFFSSLSVTSSAVEESENPLPSDSLQAAAPVSPKAPLVGLAFQSDDSMVLSSENSRSAVSPVIRANDPSGELGSVVQSIDSSSNPSRSCSLRVSVASVPYRGLSALYVTFSGVEMRNKETGERVNLGVSPVEVDLLKLKDGVREIFSDVSVNPGIYHQLRFFISSVSVVLQGRKVKLAVPSSLSEHGLRIYGSIRVRSGESANIVVEFDARKMLIPGKKGWVIRPLAKLRHLHFRPAGIHFEEASDGTMSLVAPRKTVRAKAWIQLKDTQGNIRLTRTSEHGAFRFDRIPKIVGLVEVAIVQKNGKKVDQHRGKHEGGEDEGENEDGSFDHGMGYHWVKLAWMELLLDFSVSVSSTDILASQLDSLFREPYESVGRDPSRFLALFASDSFRHLAGKYLIAKGRSLPGDFSLPELSEDYPFALEGPDYRLPGFAAAATSVGFYSSGGPMGAGCSDGRLIFAGRTGSANDYSGLGPDQAIVKMSERGLPFTGLLAEFKAVCESKNLATMSCATLGSLARSGSRSLPAEPLVELDRALNTPQGGLLAALLSCVRPAGPGLSDVALPQYPTSEPGCWFGCGGAPESSYYLSHSALISKEQILGILPDPSSILDLDSLVLAADEGGVSPIQLAASYVAHFAESRVHGFQDFSVPRLFNLLPADGTHTDQAQIQVSGVSSERSAQSVKIAGSSTAFELGVDGLIHFGPVTVSLQNGENAIEVQVQDVSGNSSTTRIQVVAELIVSEPSPSLTPTPEPTPTPTPTPTVIPGVDPLCSAGAFVPKSGVVLGLSIDPADGALGAIVSNFQSLGLNPRVYSREDIADGKPVADGVTVLVISRVVTFTSVTPAYIAGIKSFIASGGSLLGEYDGASLFFSTFTTPAAIVLNLTPSLELFAGSITGGGILLPLVNSTTYVTDAADPLMAGMPSSFLVGSKAAFALTGHNDGWLHISATFTSAGFQGLVPVGTYPAVLSGRCGSGRVAFYMMNHLSVANLSPISTMVTNTLKWLIGD